MQHGIARIGLLIQVTAWGLLSAGSASALDVQAGSINRLTNPNAYDTYEPFCCGLPMIQPGNKAQIDDYWINATIRALSNPVVGDYMGTRATSPSGSMQTNYVDWNGACWTALFLTSCSPGAFWYMGTRIQYTPGPWKIEWISNGISVKTENFQVVPYELGKYGGDGQAIAVKSTTPQALVARMLKPDGTPASGKTVSFSVSARPGGARPAGGLSNLPAYAGSTANSLDAGTDANGLARVYFETGGKAGAYTITATSSTLAPGTSVSFSVTASGTDPLDAAAVEKNLGPDPANNSSCPKATAANTDNPINIATGNKTAVETDYDGAGVFPLRMLRYYNSKGTRAGSFGANWRGFYDRSLVIVSTTTKGKTTTVAEAVRPDGRVLRFTLTNGGWVGDPDIVDRLQSVAGGYRFTCGDDQVETYNNAGRLGAVAAREGFAQSLAYDGQGRLTQVTDAFGRSLALQYDASGRVAQLSDPAGKAYSYTYSAAGNLASVRYPDLALRLYHYDNAAFARALTGITDENGVRIATYDYDSGGRAIRSLRAGDAMQRSVHYYSNGTRDVVDAVGIPRRYAFAVIQGVSRRTGIDNAACASCGNAVMSTGYSASGFVSSLTDYRGTPTSFVRDARGLEAGRTEASGHPEARTIATTWHASFRLPLTTTSAGQRTSWSYDVNGRVTGRTIIDTATNAARSWSYAYNAQGLLASVDGPRTDLADITGYAYDTQGNLVSATNPLGQVTRFTSHDAHGRPLSMTDPNGLVTTYTYDLRGRLTSRNAGGQVTSHSYDPAGQLVRTTHPDATWLDRHYDAAQRLVGMVDSGGHRVAYTLDAEGRRIRLEHFDGSGSSTHVRRYTFDPLGRVLAEIDALDRVRRRYSYDANGNRIAETDAFGASTTLAYDRLDRLGQRSDALGATVAYAYDARDNLTRVTDPVGMITGYSYDGLDNRIQEASPDAGTQQFGYDSAGNLRSRNWPNGRAAALAYDALDRPVSEDYGSGVQVNYQYDSAINGIGRLTAMTDPAGSTSWAYDAWGRVLRKNRSTGTRVLDTRYGYNSAGRLVNLVYPSGRVLGHAYDSGGRIASLSLDGSPLATGIDWLPAGPARSWAQGNGRFVNKSFDRDGQLQTQDFEGGLRTLAYDAKGRITQVAEWGGYSSYGYDAVDRLSAQSGLPQDWSYGYDANGNRINQSAPGGTTGYAYSGNRLQSASGAEARSFIHDAAGNLIADGAASYTYDARNRLMQAPGAAFAYDGHGLRVYKGAAATTRYYAHDMDRKLLGEYDATAAIYETVWLGTTPIAVMKGGQRFWIDADQIDSPRVVRNDADQIVWRWQSEAFGSSAANEDPLGQGSFEFNLRFPGQVYDRETGLHHNDQRDYAPRTGRYVQSDPIGLAGGINTFAYVGGNPVSTIDPTGLDATVCLYPGAGPFGHVGIGINSSATSGFYPRSNAPGNPITGTRGVVQGDSKAAQSCKSIPATSEQDKAMSDFMRLAGKGSGSDYALLTSNCVSFVHQVLNQGGVLLPGPSPRPRLFFDSLPGTPTGP